MVQEVVKQIAAPPPVVVSAPAPLVETFAPAPMYGAPAMAAPIVETIAPAPMIGAPVMAAPLVETFAPAPMYGAPIVETVSPYGVGMTTAAPLVGSISAAVPMTTMAAPMTTMAAPMTTIGAPFVGTSYGLPPTIL